MPKKSKVKVPFNSKVQARQDKIQSHISAVQRSLRDMAKVLEKRAKNHDKSKLSEPELTVYAQALDHLRTLDKKHPQYEDVRKVVNFGLYHHFLSNSHHPEHHIESQKEGEIWDPMSKMDLFDILEMIADWKADSGGNLDYLSGRLQESQKRYNMSPQLVEMVVNTITSMEPVQAIRTEK